MEQLFAIAESININNLDTQASRPQSLSPKMGGQCSGSTQRGMATAWWRHGLPTWGVWTTRGSVERLIKGLPPYQGRRSRRCKTGPL